MTDQDIIRIGLDACQSRGLVATTNAILAVGRAVLDAPLSWTGNDGRTHIMPREAALLVLHRLYDEWPGGLEEVDAALLLHQK